MFQFLRLLKKFPIMILQLTNCCHQKQYNNFINSIRSYVPNSLFEEKICCKHFLISNFEELGPLLKNFAHFLEKCLIFFLFCLSAIQYLKNYHFIQIILESYSITLNVKNLSHLIFRDSTKNILLASAYLWMYTKQNKKYLEYRLHLMRNKANILTIA